MPPIPLPPSARGGGSSTSTTPSATPPATPPPAPPAVDLAAVGASVARGRQLATAALAAAPNPRNSALATDVFDSAERAIAAPGAEQAITTYKAADATAIPGIVATFGGALGQPGAVPPQFAGREVTTIGRLPQTGPAGDAGERILRVPDSSWSPDLNALWMQDAANRGDVIKLATGVSNDTSSLAGNPTYGGVSVFTRELAVLQAAGYTRQGDFLVPPR